MGLSQFAVRSPTKVAMLFLGIILLGWISLRRLPINLFPDLRSPKITVVVSTKGLSPEEVERRVSRQLERSLLTIRHVRDVVTFSRDESAVGVVEFDWNTDMDFALLDVKKGAANLANLDDVREVNVYRYDPNELPILTLAVYGSEDLEELYRLAYESLKPELERLEGVAAAQVAGGLQPEVLVAVDENLLLHYGIDMQDVVSAIRRSTVNASGGWVETGSERLLLKSLGELQSLDQLAQTAITTKKGNPIFLRDIARIEEAPKEPESIVRFNGHPAVGVLIKKEAEANTVRVVQTVEEALKEYRTSLPSGVKIETAYDQSVFVRTAIRELFETAAVGILLAVAVLLVFLRSFTPTMIIATAIPISIIGTFNLMYFQNLSLNIMTLGGLALGSGMLVDCAVVVLENIYRHRQEGALATDAAVVGAREVGAAITASTLTTVIVFLPIVFVRGIAGYLFKEQALTVTYSLVTSLVVALLLIPMLASRFLRAKKRQTTGHRHPRYRRLLQWSLDHRKMIVGIALLSVVVAVILFPTIPREFIPKAEQAQFLMKLEMPPGTRIEVTDKVVQHIENLLAPHRAAIKSINSRSGVAPEALQTGGEEIEGPNTAEISVVLDTATTHPMTATQIVDAIGPNVAAIPDVQVKYLLQQSSLTDIVGGTGAPIVLEVSSENLAQLAAVTESVRRMLESLRCLYNVRTNLIQGNPQVVLQPYPVVLASTGFDIQTLADAIRVRLTGDEVTTYKSERGDLDIRVASKQIENRGISYLSGLRLRSRTGQEVTLADLGRIEIERGPREIIRRNQKRIARVTADIRSGKLSDAVAVVKREIERLPVPPQFSGEEEQRIESFKRLGLAFALAAILVYMTIAATLESLVHPFTIMLSLPLAAIGVVLGLVAFRESLNLMAYIGIVMLAGIVVNNAIVLLDCVNQLRGQGMDVRTALLTAGERRLRPILMTTLTTVLGLAPMTLGIGEGSQLRRPLAVAVMGGLVSSTLLTLVFIPVAYSYVEIGLARLQRLWKREKSNAER
jgi:HAE1 family hydrophobic/amphiphilic exporter-1